MLRVNANTRPVAAICQQNRTKNCARPVTYAGYNRTETGTQTGTETSTQTRAEQHA